MSGILEGVKRAANRRGISDRVDGLERAVDAAAGRLPDDIVAEARVVLDRAGQRLRLSPDHTVVGLAGATGSGKSSLFNAICGLDLAGVGIKRPTTSWALACAWGSDGAPELLTWLGIPPRHQVSRGSMLSDEPADRDLAGLVLLDLPDHDSTEVSHHLEVDRFVDMADLLVWILDPQKYADAAIHDRYLRPLAAHADVMLVVLNHIDELPPDQVAPCLADVRRVLAADGLASVPVLGTSAVRGDGLDSLRDLLIERVAAKESSRTRMLSSVTTAAEALSEVTGNAHPEGITSAGRAELLDAFADAAGVPVVVRAVESSTRTRARQATGWPLTKWLSKLRPDPLKRLHLGSAGSAARSRTSIPAASPVQRARVDVTVREVVDEATRGLPAPWVDSTRRASVARLDDLGDALDQAVMTTELGVRARRCGGKAPAPCSGSCSSRPSPGPSGSERWLPCPSSSSLIRPVRTGTVSLSRRSCSSVVSCSGSWSQWPRGRVRTSPPGERPQPWTDDCETRSGQWVTRWSSGPSRRRSTPTAGAATVSRPR